MNSTILEKIIENIKNYPENNAIWVDKKNYTYRELFDISLSLASLLREFSEKDSYVAIFSDRNIFAYQAILASLFSGNAYVPLNPGFPIERNIRIISEVSCKIICVDTKKEIAVSFLEKIPPMIICLFREDLKRYLSEKIKKHQYVYWRAFRKQDIKLDDIFVSQNKAAYLMFTSGSTGQPKGIAIQHSHLSQYVNAICELYQPHRNDKFSQLCELTFDLSVHEMFVCWASGATLYVVPESYILGIKNFIKTHKITHWTSVPSNITLLHQLKQLEPDCFPSLKVSFFCGEALQLTQAKQWKSTAPYSVIANLYGPTEATVTFTYFNWCVDNTMNIVPIGVPLSGQQCCLIDQHGELVKNGEVGELCLSGNQVIESYWNNPDRTKKSFKKFSWDEYHNLWYLTGDLARWDDQYGYIFHGRTDDQWKIRGYRVEKLEIEMELKKIAMNDGIAVVPIWHEGGYIQGVAAFVIEKINASKLLKLARESLPSQLVPQKIISLSSLPQNANGKIDYLSLKNLLPQYM